MSNRRSNYLEPLTANNVTQMVQESIPTFEEAEKLFYANEKAKNRSKPYHCLAPGKYARL
ncbi:hypothetical protein [Desulforamulus ruminis]|uniref:hypothetical protein n=1 Tax=Desulforamulus ruminis TaxID=1564 RepID=UPI0002E1B79D|nr:hypothetical protein [Desulforamulus ruminis]